MKKQIQISLLSFCLCSLILIFAQGCCKEKCHDIKNPECENYDPCYGKKPVKASIKIGLINSFMPVNGDENFVNEDSIFCAPVDDKWPLYSARHSQFIGFKCMTPGVKTTWKLGSEIITDSFYARSFSSNKGIMGKYTVTLMVEKIHWKRHLLLCPILSCQLWGSIKCFLKAKKIVQSLKLDLGLFRRDYIPKRNLKLQQPKVLVKLH